MDKKIEVSREFFERALNHFKACVGGPPNWGRTQDLEALRLYDEGQDILKKQRDNR